MLEEVCYFERCIGLQNLSERFPKRVLYEVVLRSVCSTKLLGGYYETSRDEACELGI